MLLMHLVNDWCRYLLFSSVLWAQQVGTVDLTSITPQERKHEIVQKTVRALGLGGISSSGDLIPRKTLLTIRPQFPDSQMERGEITVSIVNSSEKPFLFPISSDPREVEPAQPNEYRYRSATISWSHTEDNNSPGVLALYGSASVHGTTVLLQPDEWVSLRFKVSTSATDRPLHLTLRVYDNLVSSIRAFQYQETALQIVESVATLPVAAPPTRR